MLRIFNLAKFKKCISHRKVAVRVGIHEWWVAHSPAFL